VTDSDEKPHISLSDIHERDALTYEIGRYFETFANVEVSLSDIVAGLLNIKPAHIQFLWKGVFTDQKIKTTRRTIINTLGTEHPFWIELKPILNELSEKAASHRNTLAHGLILEERGKTKLGKPGASPFLQFQEFSQIAAADIQKEIERLSRIGLALMKAKAELA
jgi:hypothetical protein